VPGNPVWPRPVLIPLPKEVAGVSRPQVDLAGTWKVNASPPADFWMNSVDPAGWSDILVPGELAAQGIQFARDNEFAYKRPVEIPADAKGNRVLLRFDGVYSYARVWVNGKFVRDHHGGFTSWDCDITECVTPGQTAWVAVGVTDRSDDISYASNYAKHCIGGILRGVKLVILPPDYLTRLHVETGFDSSYKDGRLHVLAEVSVHTGRAGELKLHLTDAQGIVIPLSTAGAAAPALSPDKPGMDLHFQVPSPWKWDAEHPNLYTLGAELMVGGSTVEKLERKIGFRKVERRKNRLYVNGDAIKLRGVCRHDAHPLLGRAATPEQDEKDAVLLRDANVNFVRTSHYPPTEAFLEACDRYGIYVEEESAVCFVGQNWSVTSGGSESSPEFTARYMNPFAEMIERDRSHPSVIIWSLGNESRWGSNFQKEHDYAKHEDPSRPIIFSYPQSVPQGVDCYDLLSEHYPKFDGDLTSKDIPKLNDEYAHVSCYNTETLKRDPGVRNFWGQSLKRFWENCYRADGCLGGAIWAGFDEVFMLPASPVGYGEWGIVDGWRRPKPEYWLTKKAYSPVRIPDNEIEEAHPGVSLQIPVKNWFNHTNLQEIKIVWKVGADSGEVEGLNVAPGAEGTLTIPPRNWQGGQILNLKFFCAGGVLVDEFSLRIGKRMRRFADEQGPAPKISEDARFLAVQGAEFTLRFDKATGLMAEGTFRGRKILESGPFLNLGSVALPPWWLTGIRHSTTSVAAVINLSGAYLARQGGEEGPRVEFEIRIDGQGLITTGYSIHGELPQRTSELGIAYTLASSIDRLTWDRKALWSVYPPDHIGRPQGTATRQASTPPEIYRREPQGPWSDDSKDFFLFGPDDPGGRGTPDFRSLRENIWHASGVLAGTELRVRAESDGTDAVRVEVLPDGKVRLNIDNLWGYPDLNWGNLSEPVTVEPGYKNSVRMRLTDNDEGPP